MVGGLAILASALGIAALLYGARRFALWIARLSEGPRPPLPRYDAFNERANGDCFPVIPECVEPSHRSERIKL